MQKLPIVRLRVLNLNDWTSRPLTTGHKAISWTAHVDDPAVFKDHYFAEMCSGSGLVFKAHIILYHTNVGSIVIKKKKKNALLPTGYDRPLTRADAQGGAGLWHHGCTQKCGLHAPTFTLLYCCYNVLMYPRYGCAHLRPDLFQHTFNRATYC